VSRHARETHRELDRAFTESCARDGCDGAQPELVHPIRWRKDIIVSDATLLRAAKLWSKKSQKNGRQYLVGRLGGLRVLIFENADKRGDDDHTHVLMVGEAEDKPRPVEKAQ
jgi:hypothetical protein